jgi:hypothetical protein
MREEASPLSTPTHVAPWPAQTARTGSGRRRQRHTVGPGLASEQQSYAPKDRSKRQTVTADTNIVQASHFIFPRQSRVNPTIPRHARKAWSRRLNPFDHSSATVLPPFTPRYADQPPAFPSLRSLSVARLAHLGASPAQIILLCTGRCGAFASPHRAVHCAIVFHAVFHALDGVSVNRLPQLTPNLYLLCSNFPAHRQPDFYTLTSPFPIPKLVRIGATADSRGRAHEVAYARLYGRSIFFPHLGGRGD